MLCTDFSFSYIGENIVNNELIVHRCIVTCSPNQVQFSQAMDEGGQDQLATAPCVASPPKNLSSSNSSSQHPHLITIAPHLLTVSWVTQAEDALWVWYQFTSLVDMPGRLRTIMEQITELMLQLGRNESENGVTRMMHQRLRYQNETLKITLENYTDISFSNRTKRALINGFGQLSHMLFGTAMDEDVEDLGERYNQFFFFFFFYVLADSAGRFCSRAGWSARARQGVGSFVYSGASYAWLKLPPGTHS